MPKAKKKTGISLKQPKNIWMAALAGLLVGVAGTVAVTAGHAATIHPGLYPDISPTTATLIPGTSNVYAFKMGNPFTVIASYKKSTKNPVGKLTCWYVANAPSTWPNYYDSTVAATAMQGTPIFSQTVSPTPASGQDFKIATTGTGPAVCQSQLFDGTTLLGTGSFGTL